jgi:WD40 repeat protein
MDKELRLPFSCAIQSPDRRFLVFCAGKFLQPIDLTTLQFVGVTQLKNEAHDGLIKNIAFNRCGTFLISCGDDKLIKAWDINSWICCRQVFVF